MKNVPSSHSAAVTLEEFEGWNKLRRRWLKLKDRRRYEELKRDSRNFALIRGYSPPALRAPVETSGRPASFKHAGNAGDIIYALPAIRALAGAEGAMLHLELDVPMKESQPNHPLGGVQLNRKMYDLLAPLLANQDYIRTVSVYAGDKVDYDLDTFRAAPLFKDRIGIPRWYFHLLGVASDLSQPWLRAEPDRAFSQTVVVARSARYQNRALDHSILRRYRQVAFVGVEQEFHDFRRHLPAAEWVQVPDFNRMASVIAGSRLFIGNNSFLYSLAEGLKAPRVFELDPGMPNVVPTGENAYDVLFQSEFERVVEKLFQRQ